MLRAAQRLLGQRATAATGLRCAGATVSAAGRQLVRARLHAAPFSYSRPALQRASAPLDSARSHSSIPPPTSPVARPPLDPSVPPAGLPPSSDFERSFLVSPNPAAKPRSILNKSAFVVTEVSLAIGSLFCAMMAVRAATETSGVPSPQALLPMLFSDADAALLLLSQSVVVTPITVLIYVAAQGLAAKLWPSVMRVTVAPPPPSPASEATADSAKSGSHKRGYSFFRGTRPIPSLPRSIIIVIACIAGQLVVLFALQHVDATSPEEPVLVEASLTGGRDLMGLVGIVGPLSEELLLRGFLFARLARVAGVLPALVVSSALFGVMHWSFAVGSEKVVGATVVGSMFAVSHRLVQSLKAPVIMHSLSNALSFAQQGAAGPLKSMDKLAIILQNQWSALFVKDQGIARRKRWALLAMGGMMPATAQTEIFSRWLSPDLESLSPAADALVSSIFHGLDRGQKNYLRADEFAYGAMLCPQHHRYFNAVLGVLERAVAEGSEHGGGLEGAAGAIGGSAGLALVKRRSAERAAEVIAQAEGNLVRKRPRTRPMLELPNAHFFSASDVQMQRMEVAPLLSDPAIFQALAMPPPPLSAFSVTPGLCRPSGFRLAPSLEPAHAYTSDRCTQLQRRIMEEYYDAYWSAAYRAYFVPRTFDQQKRTGSSADSAEDQSAEASAVSSSAPVAFPGCSLPAFSRFVASELLVRPTITVAWLSALSANLRADAPSTLQPHPMHTLIEEHQKGRQGHLGHRHGTEYEA